MSDETRSSALSDVLAVYAISMATGTSLDLRQNCRAFLKTMKTRRGLAYAGVWVKRSLLTGSGDAIGARLVYSTPAIELPPDRSGIGPDDPVIARIRSADAFSIGPDDPDYSRLVDDPKLSAGALTVYALGNIGLLKLVSHGRTTPWTPMELTQLRAIVEKFTRSVADCLSYERVRVSEGKYRALFEESRDAVFISTPEGRILDMNKAGAEMLGYSQAEIKALHIGRDLYEDPADWDAYRATIEERGSLKDFELRLKRRDGERVIVRETSARVRDDSGAVIAYRGIMHDVTEHYRLQHQLAHAQKMESLGLLAGGIAHDFNNLLTGVLGYTSLLQQTVAGDARAQRYLGTVEQSARRAQELTAQLLGFARGGTYEVRPAYLHTVVEETLRLLERVLPASIQVSAFLAEELPTVEIDAGQIQQVLMNLCINARDAMPNGGRLTLTTRATERDGSYVTLSIEDTGIGMSPETARRIFEPFFTTKPKGQGTGLGLAVAYGVIQHHGGQIAVQSEPGVGTTFEVHLPVSGKPPASELPTTERHMAPSGRRDTILVVDDDPVVRRLACDILEAQGHEVLTAADGLEAVAAYRARTGPIHLVILDMIMPHLDGVQAFEALRLLDPDVRVVISSGFSHEDRTDELLRSGVFGFLKKPYRAGDLIRTVREAAIAPRTS